MAVHEPTGPGYPAQPGGPAAWPDEFVAIGRTDRGDYFALHPRVGEFVLGLCPMGDTFYRVADSQPAFADWLVTLRPYQ